LLHVGFFKSSERGLSQAQDWDSWARSEGTRGIMAYQTEQENFWAGQFGTDYVARNRDATGRIGKWAHFLAATNGISSAIVFGANIGLNLLAIRALIPNCKLTAVEINKTAVDELHKISGVTVHHASIDFQPKEQSDLSFTFGVLIHLNPDHLSQAYERPLPSEPPLYSRQRVLQSNPRLKCHTVGIQVVCSSAIGQRTSEVSRSRTAGLRIFLPRRSGLSGWKRRDVVFTRKGRPPSIPLEKSRAAANPH
jgi:hypothetical protein